MARPSRNQCGGRHVALGDRDEARQPRLGGQQIVAVGVEIALGDAIADRRAAGAWDRKGSRTPSPRHSRAPAGRGRAGAGRACRSHSRRARGVDERAGFGVSGVPPPARREQSRSGPHLGRGGQGVEEAMPGVVRARETRPGQQRVHVTGIALHGRGDGAGPRHQLRRRPVATLGVQRPRPCRPGCAPGRPACASQRAHPAGASGTVSSAPPGLRGAVELAAGDRLGAPVVGNRRRGLAGEFEGVPSAGDHARPAQRAASISAQASRARAGDRRDSRCPPTRRTAARADAGRACRTSCRSARGSCSRRSIVASVASRRSDGVEQCRASRSRGPRPWTADRGRCSWARSGGRSPASGLPGSCRAAARGPPALTKVSKKRQVRRAMSAATLRLRRRAARRPPRGGGRLTQAHERGETHPEDEERAPPARPAAPAQATTTRPRPQRDAAAIAGRSRAGRGRARTSACAAVTHSSRRRRVT